MSRDPRRLPADVTEEASEADRLDQQESVLDEGYPEPPDDAAETERSTASSPRSTFDEADEADVAEQAQDVGDGDEDYPPDQ